MTLVPGDRLGPYEILAPLGAGGMGTVYKARDTRLDRFVAVKVSHEQFSERFQREAQAIAALSHPNICTLYDVGPDYLVMEYVEGHPLNGPLPLEKTLAYTAQICDALDAAHRKGIIHRDLKPSNILVTRQGVKVLDFGIARMAGQKTLTQRGDVMGTPAYMPPEQWEGKETDARSDIYSLGCVIYEMATGERIPHKTLEPPVLDRAVKGCLATDPDERWQSVREVKLVLETALENRAAGPARRPFRIVWAAAVLLAAAVALALSLMYFRKNPPEERAIRLELHPPESTTFNSIAVSPNGRTLAFTATGSGRKTQLWIRELDAAAARPLPQTEGASNPFWSPDSRWIGFFAQGNLKKIEISGGSPQTLATASSNRGGTWSREGVIVFAPYATGPLLRIPSSGGDAEPATEVDASRRQDSHRWPQFLPDGRRLLYFTFFADPEYQGIYAGSLDSKKRIRLLGSDGSGAFAQSSSGGGHLLFVREGKLMAQPFDPEKLLSTGEAVVLVERIGELAGGFSKFSVSDNGVLVYGPVIRDRRGSPVWFDRSGKQLGAVGAPGNYRGLDLSPDARRLAASRVDYQNVNIDLWIFELSSNSGSRFTFHTAIETGPLWSPDGTHVLFASSRDGPSNIYRKLASGAGEEELLLRTPYNKFPTGRSPDGRWLLYQESDPRTLWDLWLLPLEGERKPVPLLRTASSEQWARFSPDGKWIAYQSNETGSNEIYVRAFSPHQPGNGGKWQISAQGGIYPQWRGDGKELFYLAADRSMMAVPVKTSSTLEAATPRRLFTTRIMSTFLPGYAVTADGQRFLIITGTDEAEPERAPATVVVNWTAGVKR